MSSLPRTLLRPARRVLARSSTAGAPLRLAIARGMANAPPMEPHKARTQELGVGELEGATITIEPLRRVGEDEKTMRARLVYQSRKRGILETDLLLSTFADQYLPTMAREQMVEYDLFLDENDWDIYYWATQEEPAAFTANKGPVSKTTDTSSAAYGSSEEAAVAEQTAETTGGSPLEGEHADAKAYASAPPPPPPTYKGEWAQTVGTFKPAYRPVPVRWQNSTILKMLRDHVRARSGSKGGMAFMPALRS